MNNRSEFNLATAALEHLELLNRSNQNPLEIAAQFRTLLRSNKLNKSEHLSNNDYAYIDYITANATNRKRERPRSLIDHRWKFAGKVQYEASEDVSTFVEDIYPEPMPRHPSINWKQLREKQCGYKLEKVKKFLSTKLRTTRSSREERMNTSISSFTTVSDHTASSMKYSSPSRSSSSSSSNSIRTPSISPINTTPRSTNYTISRMKSTSMDSNNAEICFPIADCNLIIKQKPIEQMNRYSQCKSNVFP